MTNGSSDGRKFTPAFIAPKVEKPDVSACRWHMLVPFETTPCDLPPHFTHTGPPAALCIKHRQEIAKDLGWVSRDQARRNVEERAERVSRTMLAQKDETIAHLRKWLQEERRPEPPKAKATPVEGTVYVLLSDNLVKIGWASDLDARMKAYSPGARILAVMPGTKADETKLHRKYADLKTNRREWFTYHPRVMEEVERIVREHGQPPRELNEPMQTQRIVGPRLDRPIQRRARSRGK